MTQSMCEVRILTGKEKGDVTTNFLSHRLTHPNTEHSFFSRTISRKDIFSEDEKILEMRVEYLQNKERWPGKNAGEISLGGKKKKKQTHNTLQMFSIRFPRASHDFGSNPLTQIKIIWTKCSHLKALSLLKSCTMFYKGKCTLTHQATLLQ